MVKMYTLNEKGILQIIEIPIKVAIILTDEKSKNLNKKYFEVNYKDLKFLTMGEFELCSEMDIESRKLYYELKED